MIKKQFIPLAETLLKLTKIHTIQDSVHGHFYFLQSVSYVSREDFYPEPNFHDTLGFSLSFFQSVFFRPKRKKWSAGWVALRIDSYAHLNVLNTQTAWDFVQEQGEFAFHVVGQILVDAYHNNMRLYASKRDRYLEELEEEKTEKMIIEAILSHPDLDEDTKHRYATHVMQKFDQAQQKYEYY